MRQPRIGSTSSAYEKVADFGDGVAERIRALGGCSVLRSSCEGEAVMSDGRVNLPPRATSSLA